MGHCMLAGEVCKQSSGAGQLGGCGGCTAAPSFRPRPPRTRRWYAGSVRMQARLNASSLAFSLLK